MATVMSDLRRLGEVRAPAGFALRVMAQAGVADSYAVFPTVLGPVYVAWNGLGVSAAMRSKPALEVEEWLARGIRRPLVRAEAPAGRAGEHRVAAHGVARPPFRLGRLCP